MKFGKYKQQLWFYLFLTNCSSGLNAFKIPHKQKSRIVSSCIKWNSSMVGTEPKAPVVSLSNTNMYKSVFTTRVIRALSDPETPLCLFALTGSHRSHTLHRMLWRKINT